MGKQNDFNNLIYYFKGESGPEKFIGFKGPLGFHKNMKDVYTALENAEENSKNLNQISESKILKENNKLEEQKSRIKNI